MNTLTATTAYSSGTAASSRPASRPLQQAPQGTRAAPAASWLERLATWYESQPKHRRVGSYTLLLQLRTAPHRAA